VHGMGCSRQISSMLSIPFTSAVPDDRAMIVPNEKETMSKKIMC